MNSEDLMAIKTVGVVGCGTMGAGITQVCAQSGYQVVVSEANEQYLKKGLTFINNILGKSVAKGAITAEEKDRIMARIKGTTDTGDFSSCDLVIEAATEDISLKKKIFAELDRICPKETLLATNTSCLSVTDMAVVTGRADKVIGIHFFNPAPVMKLVEIVRTIIASQESVKTGKEFAQSLGKEAVVTKDTPGFIVNYLIIPFILNAIRMYENGVASREEIDLSIKLGLSHPMGPLALADLMGLDVVALIANGIYQETRDAQFVLPTLARKMVAAGQLGRKTKKGFYDYA
jgi:3-hydroxybutyryl-CoA dehydrogenase